LLDSTSTHKLLYSLKIIEGLKGNIANNKAQKEVASQKESLVVVE